jgi:hypothetical protein
VSVIKNDEDERATESVTRGQQPVGETDIDSNRLLPTAKHQPHRLGRKGPKR